MTSYNTEGFKALELLNIIGNELSHEKICSLTEDQLLNYKKKYDNFMKYNQMTLTSINAPKDLNKKKGDSLEELAIYLLEISGGIFESYCNVKTGTN